MKIILNIIDLFITPILIYGYGFGGWEITNLTRTLLCILLFGSFVRSLKEFLGL